MLPPPPLALPLLLDVAAQNAFSGSFVCYAEVLAQHGLEARDPASVFPSPEAAEQLMRQAGYASVSVQVCAWHVGVMVLFMTWRHGAAAAR